jgi:hypothetical protein
MKKAPIKEPLEVDLEVVARDLTDKEAEHLQKFIAANKAKLRRAKGKSIPKKRVRRSV